MVTREEYNAYIQALKQPTAGTDLDSVIMMTRNARSVYPITVDENELKLARERVESARKNGAELILLNNLDENAILTMIDNGEIALLQSSGNAGYEIAGRLYWGAIPVEGRRWRDNVAKQFVPPIDLSSWITRIPEDMLKIINIDDIVRAYPEEKDVINLKQSFNNLLPTFREIANVTLANNPQYYVYWTQNILGEIVQIDETSTGLGYNPDIDDAGRRILVRALVVPVLENDESLIQSFNTILQPNEFATVVEVLAANYYATDTPAFISALAYGHYSLYFENYDSCVQIVNWFIKNVVMK